MGHRWDREELRTALYRADDKVLMAALTNRVWPEDALQLLGEAVLVVAQHGADVESPAHRCCEELRERGWPGDTELADQIESKLAWGPSPMLRSLPVDLEELANVLEGDPVMGGGRIDLLTGEVWPRAAIGYFEEVGEADPEDEDDERWLYVFSEGSRAAYRDMEYFIGNLDDDRIADRLAGVIHGRGAFRRFKDALAYRPDLMERWYAFSGERHRGRARAWLADNGYAPTPPNPPVS